MIELHASRISGQQGTDFQISDRTDNGKDDLGLQNHSFNEPLSSSCAYSFPGLSSSYAYCFSGKYTHDFMHKTRLDILFSSFPLSLFSPLGRQLMELF